MRNRHLYRGKHPRLTCPLGSIAIVLGATMLSAGTEVPTGVSPGGPTAISEVEARCPTFSWGGAAETTRWELVIYRVAEEEGLTGAASEEMRPVLSIEIPGTARAWTPAVGQCLEPGGRYAWAVRAADKSQSGAWSEPRLFQVAAAPTMAEVRDAMAVLQAYLGAESLAIRPASDLEDRMDSIRPGEEVEPRIASPEGAPPSLGGQAAIRGAQSALTGDASGLVGETASPDGAGAVLGNMAGGPDLVLDGSADTDTDTVLSQAGLDRASSDLEIFDIGNSQGGGMLLTIDGVEVVTTATDADTLYTAGNQLDLSGTQFDVLEGPGSGLDADTLDGLDSTDFLATGTDNWVNTGGDTMTGTLTLNPQSGIAISTNDDLEIGNGALTKGGVLFLHRPGNFNTGVGLRALESNAPTAFSLTAVGESALRSNSTGIANTAVGTEALESNVDGDNNTALGRGALRASLSSDNTALGATALRWNTSGDKNTAVGSLALLSNTTGPWNVATGHAALRDNTTGDRNVAVGGVALAKNTTGLRNVAVGIDAMGKNETGSFNVAVGGGALLNNEVSDNTAVGHQSMTANTTGTLNTALGSLSLLRNTTGSYNTAVGSGALFQGTSASFNTAVGLSALHETLTGLANTAVGASALQDNSTGADNTAMGFFALQFNTSGGGNTAVGARALQDNLTGLATAVGWDALRDNTTGTGNTALGAKALASNTTGFENTAVGFEALNLSTGNRNTAIGDRALISQTTGEGNIALGDRAGASSDTGSDNIFIGHTGASGDDKTIRIGRVGYHQVASIGGDVGIGIETPSNRLHVQGSVNGTATPANHVAFINNSSAGFSADALAIRLGTAPASIDPANNFITFFGGDNSSLGSIQGNGSGGIELGGPGADYAEWLPRLDPKEQIEPGQVVGLFGDAVSKTTTGAEGFMVASTGPIVAGNDPGAERQADYIRVAFVGQAEVKVVGPVQQGDYLIPSGRDDGRAVAVRAFELDFDSLGRVIGRALEERQEGQGGSVRTLVGVADPGALAAVFARQQRLINSLNLRLESMEGRIANGR